VVSGFQGGAVGNPEELRPGERRTRGDVVVTHVGDVVRRELLGTEATYRVLEVLGDGNVLVQVIDAPGLRSGYQLRLTEAAVRDMDVVRAARSSALPARRFEAEIARTRGVS
jgi:imidazole glycerol phosphate synthase subunit HisF